MSENKVALFLVDETNEFQRALRADAERAGRDLGLTVDTHFSGIDFKNQLSLLQRSLDTDKPEAMLVMCVSDRGLQHVAERAAQGGVHLLFLNDSEDDLDTIRARNPDVALSTVCPDEMETGRIQGRQFRALLPKGGRILYVQGRIRSAAARDRTAGMLEAVQGASLEVSRIEAGWTTVDGREAVSLWLRTALRAGRHVDLIGCQNDMLARGALDALDAVAAELGRPEIRDIPVTGCDGSPDFGCAMVERGELCATVVLPRSTGPAVELAHRALSKRELPPTHVKLRPCSFPSEPNLMPISSPRKPRVGRA